MKTLLCVLAVLVLAAPASAETYVTENISTNTTWDLAGSPYIIQGNDIQVISASTLTIDPGVTVKFDADTQLSTFTGCSIVAEGSYGNEILFTSNSGSPAVDDWNTVRLWQSPASSFSYCVFEYGEWNLYPEESDPTVSDCTSRNSYYGITCVNASPQVESCDISHNWRGIGIFHTAAAPVVHDCNLYDNSAANVYAAGYTVAPLVRIDAENNWWGTDVEAEIESSIDIAGMSLYVEVDYDPWLHEVPVEASSWGRVKAMFAD